ncbi:MAG: terpene cyclase/mutase family protein [Cyclobacteriaceae bacterium]|nr:terpene cyclase/mutase family protein [Cyclobacteriaceae bacterium]
MERRNFIIHTLMCAGGLSFGFYPGFRNNPEVLKGVQDFLHKVANPDGSFRPGIDPAYPGKSDTGLSGIAAPTYATILSRTFGWELRYPDETREFFISCQQPDGAFYAPTGSMDMQAPLARLYNTVQSVVALRLMDERPKYDPMPVIDYFFDSKEFTELPLYTTSFFPLFFCALGEKMPENINKKMRGYIIGEQQDDGYLQDHVAATFHAAHYFRLAGEPTPKAEVMISRVLRDQQENGSWHLHEPDWDVHACFDALFILRQLADQKDPGVKKAFKKATDWILTCRKPDGGFAHFPDETHSDVDAVYFQVGGLVESGFLKVIPSLENEEILGWGHAMDPDKTYSCI